MNYKYQKKPVVVEAFQMTQKRRMDNSEWPNWLHEAWNKDTRELGSLQPVCVAMDDLEVVTLEGTMLISWNDWIIRGVNGEIYPCKPDIFEKTYKPAGEENDSPSSMMKDMFPSLHDSDIQALQAAAKELNRQREKEGCTPEHDDTHTMGELSQSAECYICASRLLLDHVSDEDLVRGFENHCIDLWPWSQKWWNPSPDPKRNLEKGTALALAEMSRLIRKEGE